MTPILSKVHQTLGTRILSLKFTTYLSIQLQRLLCRCWHLEQEHHRCGPQNHILSHSPSPATRMPHPCHTIRRTCCCDSRPATPPRLLVGTQAGSPSHWTYLISCRCLCMEWLSLTWSSSRKGLEIHTSAFPGPITEPEHAPIHKWVTSISRLLSLPYTAKASWPVTCRFRALTLLSGLLSVTPSGCCHPDIYLSSLAMWTEDALAAS